MALPIEQPEEGMAPEAPVETEVEVELSAEAPVEGEPAPAEVAAEPAPDLGAQLADLQAQLASLTSERDIALGQAATAAASLAAVQAEVEPLRCECAELRVKLADYELGAALTDAGLPAQAGLLVKQLYTAAMSMAPKPVSIGMWLSAALADPNSPVSALSLMRPVVAPGSDPRNSASPVNGQPPGLTRFPSFGQLGR